MPPTVSIAQGGIAAELLGKTACSPGRDLDFSRRQGEGPLSTSPKPQARSKQNDCKADLQPGDLPQRNLYPNVVVVSAAITACAGPASFACDSFLLLSLHTYGLRAEAHFFRCPRVFPLPGSADPMESNTPLSIYQEKQADSLRTGHWLQALAQLALRGCRRHEVGSSNKVQGFSIRQAGQSTRNFRQTETFSLLSSNPQDTETAEAAADRLPRLLQVLHPLRLQPNVVWRVDTSPGLVSDTSLGFCSWGTGIQGGFSPECRMKTTQSFSLGVWHRAFA